MVTALQRAFTTYFAVSALALPHFTAGAQVEAWDADAPVPLCATSTGEAGRLFEGITGYVSGPARFDRVVPSSKNVNVILPVRTPFGFYTAAFEPGSSQLRFFNDETLTYVCGIEVVPFDPDVHPLESISEGDCAWMDPGARPFLTGLANVVVSPRYKAVLIGTGLPIAELLPLSAEAIYVLGQQSGVTTVAILGDNDVVRQCPVLVESTAEYFAVVGLDENQICVDENGMTARLTVGESATLSFAEQPYTKIAVADEMVAEVTPLGETSMRVDTVAPGITNIIAVKSWPDRADVARDCLIVVE